MFPLDRLRDRIRPRLQALYGPQAEECLTSLLELFAQYVSGPRRTREQLWSERDVVLITYPDQVRAAGEPPLVALRTFLVTHHLDEVIRVLHLLPFFPATSDDGFAVVDYRCVDASLGTWDEVAALGERFDLMFDLILNHASSANDWFQKYLQNIEPYARYFVDAQPGDDLRSVVRPRTSPLLTPFTTSRGPRYVWTTFSADQVDLNFREPRVLVEMVDILLQYVRHGARILRLDAVAFLWKQLGTSCVHLPETHVIVTLLRDIVDALAPGTLLLTETNVPHAENASYWGTSDEAHLIYNFSLPPLLLDALLTGDGSHFTHWLATTAPPPQGTTLLNFTASHDGIGVRPLEALLPQERVERLVEAVGTRGGLVSLRTGQDGRRSPYELNISYFDVLGDPEHAASDLQFRRFMASQALMLALRGIPAVYFHSLLGTPNDLEGVRRTLQARAINRRKFTAEELDQLLDSATLARRVLEAYRHLLAVRIEQPAFHPDALQFVLQPEERGIVAFVREAGTSHPAVLVAANLSPTKRTLDLSATSRCIAGPDLLSGDAPVDGGHAVHLQPYQVIWLPVGPDRRQDARRHARR